MTDTVEKLAYSINEACSRANICRDGIYRAIREGRLEARKSGRRTLITEEALKRFVDNLPLFPMTAR